MSSSVRELSFFCICKKDSPHGVGKVQTPPGGRPAARARAREGVAHVCALLDHHEVRGREARIRGLEARPRRHGLGEFDAWIPGCHGFRPPRGQADQVQAHTEEIRQGARNRSSEEESLSSSARRSMKRRGQRPPVQWIAMLYAFTPNVKQNGTPKVNRMSA